MVKNGKKYREAQKKIDTARLYSLKEAVSLLKQVVYARFNETVELLVQLGIDPRHSDQLVRGTVSLPYGTGKKLRVLAFCKPDQAEEARSAGADYAGGKELAEKIEGGWLDFDVVVAAKDMMRDIGRLGKILGPRGLMPSPKAGTVTDDIPGTIKEVKAGKIEFKSDKSGNVQVVVGKISFLEANLEENIETVMKELIKVRPAAARGKYIRKAYICSTMSPALPLEVSKLGAS